MANHSVPLLGPFAQKVENKDMNVENIYAIVLVGFFIGSKTMVISYSTN